MTDENQAPVTDNATVDEVQEASWQETMGIAGDDKFAKFENPEQFVKSYRDMEVYSSRSIQLPTSDASDEAKAAFMGKLTGIEGVMATPENYVIPESADKYEFTEVEGFTGDESVGALKTKSLNLGMTQDQANGIHEFLATNIVAIQNEMTAQNNTGMAELKGLWGAGFDQKMQQTENTISALSQKIPGLDKAERTPEFIKLMDLVGDMLGESGSLQQDPRTTMTPMDASRSLNDLYQKYEGVQEGDLGYPAFASRRIELQKLGGRLNFQVDDY